MTAAAGRGAILKSSRSRLGMQWTPEAEQRLREIPFLVRPLVRRRLESLAAEAGRDCMDEAFYEEARARFGQS